mgnify:CR=1 FL=1
MSDILAKSNPEVTLKVHIHNCLTVEQELSKSISFLNSLCSEYNFFEILKICIICHDLGKSNIEFQKLLKGEKNHWNGRRHELYSTPFIKNLNEKYKEYYAYILPSRFEAFPMVILESISNAIPIIGFNIECGIKDMITYKKEGFLINEYNSKEMAKKINEL